MERVGKPTKNVRKVKDPSPLQQPPTSGVATIPAVAVSVIAATASAPTVAGAGPKLTEYRCYRVPEIQQHYIALLNDNLEHLIRFIYSNADKSPYDSPTVRVGLSMQMLLASHKLIPYQVASLIAKDLDDLRKDETYTNQWAHPSLKRKCLIKERELLLKHTEIDETISLNVADPNEAAANAQQDFENFDIQSSVSTLNVSSHCPVVEPATEADAGRCIVM